MSSEDHTQPLVNALPPAVVALALAIFASEVLLWAGESGYVGGPEAVGWRLEAIREFAFFSPVLATVVPAFPRTSTPSSLRLRKTTCG